MKRTVTRECEVGGIPFSVGDTLFLAYNSGSRDETKYERPDEIDINRKSKIQHLAFGRGIHACLGAPLARLLLRTELSVLSERLPILRLETPYEDIRYHPVGSGRGPEAVRVAWDPPNGAHAVMPFVDASHLAQQRAAKSAQMSLVVSSAKLCAKRVLHITLAHPDGSELPQWQPGAHIDVKVGKSVFHQYSLCGYPEDRSKYEIAVLEENKTGGSHQIHTTVKAGSCVVIGGPRNNFNFEPGSNKTIFIAGGIGITPIRPMALQAKEAGLDYEILYLGRGKDGMAFADELIDHHAGRLTVWTTDTPGHSRFDLEKYLGSQALDGLRVYCCGPESLLASVEDTIGHVRLERFAAKTNASKGPNTAFEVILARSNKTIQVSKDESLLDAIINAGGNVLSTCNKGLCGSCEVGVVEGLPDHRDEVLTPLERAEGKTMMACVSRCRGSRLVLDLW
jgi:vanillate O-demethylase ferredoxin subunit